MQASAELTAHLDETICFGWILNVVLRKTTIRNFPLTNKLIILKTRRQLLFRLPFFLSYFLIIWSCLGIMRLNTHRMLRKYLVFSKLIRHFLLLEIEQINSLYYLIGRTVWFNHSNLILTFLSDILENVIELYYHNGNYGPFSIFHDAIIPEYWLENYISPNKMVSYVHHSAFFSGESKGDWWLAY